MVHFIHQTSEDADKIRPSYSVSSIMAGAVTVHYVRFDRHQRGYSYIYRLFITVVTSSNAMGSDLYWPCFDIPCMGNNAYPVGILYKQLYSTC